MLGKALFKLVLVSLRGFQHDVGAFAQKHHITALLVIDCRFKMVNINWMTQSLEIVENEIQQCSIMNFCWALWRMMSSLNKNCIVHA